MGRAAAADEADFRAGERPAEVRFERHFKAVPVRAGSGQRAVLPDRHGVDARRGERLRVDLVEVRDDRGLVRNRAVEPGQCAAGLFDEGAELPGPDVPLDVGGAETVMFEGGVLHPGGTAVSDGISDDSVVSH